ncbi:MAG: hydrogenase maturation protease [Solirubrobacterales bacterium]
MSGGRRLLIGIGNELRGDDAAGLLVARAALDRELEPEPPCLFSPKGRKKAGGSAGSGAVEVIELEGEPVELIAAWEGVEAVVVADCAAPAGQPGRLHRFELGDEPLPAALGGPSTHALGLVEAVELARSLDRLPKRLVVLAVEGERFELGGEPTEVVRETAASAAAAALEDLTGGW